MPEPTTPADLLDLKMMPAWVNEAPRRDEYADFEGEEPERPRDRRAGPPRRGQRAPERERRPERKGQRPPGKRGAAEARPRAASPEPPKVTVHFLPQPAVLESVIAQIKSAAITYSVFALARMFLDKAERYAVQLMATPETPLHQLGDHGPVATERSILEGSAFDSLKEDFYTIEVTQSEPLKGNFSNVARERSSGILLGPTNHHQYQPQLRTLYEQRFSRRMSFSDFQRQIEIVSDPAVVEAWKEQARSVTTFTAKEGEPALTFPSAAEAERHFRQTHLPALLRTTNESTIRGVSSRRLMDRALGRLIEDSWMAEMRSPSKMMQELAGDLRAAGLHIFRHRRGMLFVSPIRVRAFGHESAGVSDSINAILKTLGETPGLNRKRLAEKLTPAAADEQPDAERARLSLAADLHWLISAGYVIEFHDGSLDLPRMKMAVHGQSEKSDGSDKSAQSDQSAKS